MYTFLHKHRFSILLGMLAGAEFLGSPCLIFCFSILFIVFGFSLFLSSTKILFFFYYSFRILIFFLCCSFGGGGGRDSNKFAASLMAFLRLLAAADALPAFLAFSRRSSGVLSELGIKFLSFAKRFHPLTDRVVCSGKDKQAEDKSPALSVSPGYYSIRIFRFSGNNFSPRLSAPPRK